MNGKDLMYGLNHISKCYIDEAESDTVPINCKRSSGKRVLLVAAVIMLTVLLVGCGAAYMMKMQSLRLGQTEVTKAIVDPDTLEYLGDETYPIEIFTAAGLDHTPAYQAAREWFDYLQSYEGAWDQDLDVSAAYESYGIKSLAMKEKVDEICEKYHLRLAGSTLEFRTLANLCQALGVPKQWTSDSGVTISVRRGTCRESGNFCLDLDLQLPKEVNGPTRSWAEMSWSRKNCFSTEVIGYQNHGDWKESVYTTASGGRALIACSPSDDMSYLIFDREEGMLTISVEARRAFGQEDGHTVYCYLTDTQLERIADAIDQGIQPRHITEEDVRNQPEPPTDNTQNGFTITMKSVETDGWCVRIVLGVTAPEGVVLSGGTKWEAFTTANGGSAFVPAEGQPASSGNWISQEDGDGRENTQNLVLKNCVQMLDGSEPFAPGRVWKIHLEDLVALSWEEKIAVRELLAEGEWNFTITFTEDSGDFQELELINDPVTVNAITRLVGGKKDVYGDVEVTSFTLRAMSAVLRYDTPGTVYFSTWDAPMCVVMQDGSTVDLDMSHGAPGVVWFQTEEALDLNQVAGVRMMDGTMLRTS